MTDYYLVGDVGGTKTDLSIFSLKEGNYHLISRQRVKTRDFPSLEQMISSFLSSSDLTVLGGILAVAGPVINDQVSISSSNLPWTIDRSNLINELSLPDLLLINDLEALATAIPLLTNSDLHTINAGIREKNGTIAVIAPGTGLGETFSIWDGKKYQPHISEGGNVNFAPRTDVEIELLRYLKKKQGHVSYESVCSGMGIPSIYNFFKENTPLTEPDWLIELLDQAEDPVPIIFQAAMQNDRTCEIASETVKLFTSALGAESGNLVLNTMARGGIYLGGGIPEKIIPILDSETFMDPFIKKGIMEKVMLDIPVFVITNRDSVLLGAVDYLSRYLNSG